MIVAEQQKWNEAPFCTHTVPVMFRQNYTVTAGEFAASECVDAKSAVRMYDQLACQAPKVKVARDRMRFGCADTDVRQQTSVQRRHSQQRSFIHTDIFSAYKFSSFQVSVTTTHNGERHVLM